MVGTDIYFPEGQYLKIYTMNNPHLTSLLLVEERLLEADYFARRLSRLGPGGQFGYELNALLSAARSITFLLQKEMARVPGFAKWWEPQRQQLASDPAAQFFVKLRNFSQKEGRVSVVGTTSSPGGRRWTYRFAGNVGSVPPQLLQRDIAECCREHVSKLARIVLACADAFPYSTCPRRALTPAGISALQLSLEDIEETLGFPRGWTKIGDPESEIHRLAVLREHVDGPDFDAIQRLAEWKPKPAQAKWSPSDVLSDQLVTSFVRQLEQRHSVDTAELAISLLLSDQNISK